MNAGGCDAVGRLAGMSVLVIELFISFFFFMFFVPLLDYQGPMKPPFFASALWPEQTQWHLPVAICVTWGWEEGRRGGGGG